MNREVTIAVAVRFLVACSFPVGAALAAFACSSPTPAASIPNDGTNGADGKGNGGSVSGGSAGTGTDGGGAAPGTDAGGERRRRVHIFPNVDMLYSGFDGTHSFAVPVGAFSPGDGEIVWTLSDDSVATLKPVVVPNSGPGDGHGKVSFIELVTKKAGTVKITATANGQSATTGLTVVTYTAEQYAAGEKRYVNGGSGSPACFSCHFPDGGVDHSPSYTAEWPDDGVVAIFTTGVRPDGSRLRTPKHNWTVTDAEKPGVVAYLRALPIPPPTDE